VLHVLCTLLTINEGLIIYRDMKKLNALLAITMVVLAWLSCRDLSSEKIVVTNLVCEYQDNPLGIDVAKPRFSWQIQAANDIRGCKQSAYHILVATSEENLDNNIGNLWDSKKDSSNKSVLISYDGTTLTSGTKCYWKVKVWTNDNNENEWSKTASFSIGLLERNDWKGAWINYPDTNEISKDENQLDRNHYWFRKDLDINDNISEANIYVASSGYHELYISGEKIKDYVLSPALTRLDKRVHYITYDISKTLKKGKNSFGIYYGPGWSNYPHFKTRGAVGAILVQLNTKTESGQVQSISSNKDWKCKIANSGKTGNTDIRDHGGEIIDSRLEQASWSIAEPNDTSWLPANELNWDVTLSAQMINPSRVIDTIVGKEVHKTDTDYVVDLGRNFTGQLKINFRGLLLGDSVIIYVSDSKGVKQDFGQISKYVSSGSGQDVFQHRFNYCAGRYITLSGLKESPLPEDVVGYVISTDLKRTGQFECSNDLYNRIYQTDLWTFAINTTEGYTADCPHRERLGYGEEHVATSWGIGLPNYKSGAFYTKVVRDWADVQEENGWFNNTAPQVNYHFGGPMWSSAGLTIAKTVYDYNGDIRILESIYPAGKRWLDFLEKNVKDGLLKNYADHWGKFLGDWGTPSGHQEGGSLAAEYFNNCVFAMNLMDMIQMAELLGKEEDAKKFQLRLEQLRNDIHLNFYNTEAGYYAEGRQVEQAFALSVGIIPEHLQQVVKDHLINKLKEQGYLDMGSSGLPVLLKYLISKSDLAYLLDAPLNKTTIPSYGYFLETGETAWPEFWEGDVKSRIHTCYTGISSWFIKGVVGIRLSENQPGYQKFIIKPTLDNDLTYAKAETESLYGKIKCNWEKKGEQVLLEAEIPTNTTAQIYLPTSNINSIKEGGLILDKVKGISKVDLVDNQVVVKVESGKYYFLIE